MKRLITSVLLYLLLTAGSLPILRYRALDSNGDPISGAKLHTYVSGTTTNQATYSDEALTTPNANPVVADGDGWFGEIYCDSTLTYKFVYKNASDVTQWTVDDVNCSTLTSSSFIARVKQIASNPLDYGAVGDGVANECSAVQSAVDNATGTVDLLGKTYRCDTQITLASGITFKNGTLDFSSSTATDMLFAQGTAGTATLLTSNSSAGDVVISVADASGFSSGDWVFVNSPGDVWNGATYLGELAQVDSVSSNDVTVTTPLRYGDYTTGAAARMQELTMVEDVVIDNVKFIGSESSSGTEPRMISLDMTHNVEIRNVSIRTFSDYGIVIGRSYDVLVEGAYLENGDDTSDIVGVDVTGASSHVTLTDNRFMNVATAITSNDVNLTSSIGVVKDLIISDNVVTGSSKGIFVLNKQTTHVSITGNTTDDSTLSTTIGVYYYGQYLKFADNEIGGGTGVCLAWLPTTDGQTSDVYGLITGNRCLGEIRVEYNSVAEEIDRLVISDNHTTRINTDLDGYITVDKMTITGNTVSNDILVNEQTGSGPGVTSLVIANNAAGNVEVDLLDSGDHVVISGNRLDATGVGAGVIEVDAQSAVVSGNLIAGDTVCISAVSLGGNWDISDNTCTGAGDLDFTGETADNDDVNISGNVTADMDIAGGSDRLVISGNVVGSAGLAVSTNGVHDNVSVVGNVLGADSSFAMGGSGEVSITGNQVMGGLAVSTAKTVTIVGNLVDDSSGTAIHITASGAECTVSGNTVNASSGAGIIVDPGTSQVQELTVNGNKVTSSNTGISLDIATTVASTDVTVVGNNINGPSDAVEAIDLYGRVDRYVVSNNTIDVGNAAATGIVLEGSAGNYMRYGVVNGNSVGDGGTGIAFTNDQYTVVYGNNFDGVGSTPADYITGMGGNYADGFRRGDCTDTITVADSGDSAAAAGTITPYCSHFEVTCSDTAGGCTMSFTDTAEMSQGSLVDVCNVSANKVAIPTASGVTVIGSSWSNRNLNIGQDQCVRFRRGSGGEWSQVGDGSNCVDSYTIADSGANPGVLTITPDCLFSTVRCEDTDGCEVSITETGATTGDIAYVCEELGTPFALFVPGAVGQHPVGASLVESACSGFIYITNQWYAIQ